MKKYAIAYLNLFDNENTIKIIEARTPQEALTILAGDKSIVFDTVKEYREYFSNGEIAISEPLELR